MKSLYEREKIFIGLERCFRKCNDKKTGKLLSEKLLKENHAKVMYELPTEKIER